jgi:mannose-6-phosphate isomerase-like protein (cupin superfamily)
MTTTSRSKLLGPGEGRLLSILGSEILTRVSGRDTQDGLWIMEYVVAPGFMGPPAHIHDRSYEIFYILEGELGFRVDGEERMLAKGGLALVTPGTSHNFFNPGRDPARYMGILTPSYLEGYFEELPEIVAKHGYPPPAEVMADLGDRYDIVSLGAR